ncbi:MAG TPA: CHRD domain-containing protein [Actinomycetes bacterium]
MKKLILATLVAAAAAILVASVAPTRYGDGSKAKQSSAPQAGYAAPQAQPQKQSAYSGSGNVIQAQQAPAAQQQGTAYGQSGQAGVYGQSGGQSGAGAYGSSGTSASSGSAGASQAVASGKKIKLVTSLTGGEEVPGPADKAGTGQSWVTVDGSKVCWKVTWSGLSSSPAISSHIHFGAKGVAGNIVVPFFGDARKASGKGVDQSCTTVQDVAVLNGLRTNPQNYYVNVHTKQFPKGAIRGQLALDNGNGRLALTGGSRTPTLLGFGLGVAATGLALLTMFRYRPRRLAVGGAHARRR